ncbi:MAG: thiamine phosphate synthase [Rhodospirillales bacterium]
MAAVNDPQSPVGGSCRLYLVTPPEIEIRRFGSTLESALDGGDIACVQLRLKNCSDDAVLAAADTLIPIARSRDVTFLINDRPDLARSAGADGVHIGQEDASYEEARAVIGDDGVVGMTCHNSRHLAMIAGEKGADYIAFGAFFPTKTKDPKSRADLDLIRWWSHLMTVQCVAIGGISLDNAAPVIAAGADFIAVSAGVWDHADGPREAVRRFNRLIAETRLEDPIV